MSRAPSNRNLNKRNSSRIQPASFDVDEEDEPAFAQPVMVEATLVAGSGGGASPSRGKSMKKLDYDVDPEEFEEFLEQKNNALNKGLKKKDKSKLGRDTRGGGGAREGGHHPSPLVSSHVPTVKAWPPALRKKIVDALKVQANQRKADKYLLDHQWPLGLRETVLRSIKKLPLRFFIVDDSGSMILADGRRLLAQGTNARYRHLP